MIKDDDMLKKQLWTMTQEVAKHIYAEKAGLQINVLPLLKQHIKRYSPGYYFHLGHLMKGGGTLALYLDRFSGLPQPRFWYGLYTESPPRHRVFESVARSMVPGRPLRLGDKDYAADPYERLKVPLSAFERLLIECYLKDGAYYCGLYSPYSVPLSNANRRSLASEASHFLSECARRLLGLYEPGPGKKATMRGPASKRSEQAAIRFMRKTLEASKPPYRVISRQRDVCGYDLLATRQREPKELHVEVKGAGGAVPRFFLSTTEYSTALKDPFWRLAVVTQATSRTKRTRPLMTLQEMTARFTLRPIQWEGLPKAGK